MELFTILIVIYAIWGFRCGWKFVDGRWETLEKPKMKLVKILVAFYIGLFVGVFKLAEHIFKLVNNLF